MPFKEVQIEKDISWFVGCLDLFPFFPDDYNEVSASYIVVPTNQFSSISPDSLALHLHNCSKEAEFFLAEVLSSYVEQGGRTDWQNVLPIIQKHEGQSELIRSATEILRTIRDKESRREQGKNTANEKRKEISNQYDALFVKIGRRDGFKCAMCSSSASDLQIDHIQPIAENGSNELGNLQLLCSTCNRSKSDTYEA